MLLIYEIKCSNKMLTPECRLLEMIRKSPNLTRFCFEMLLPESDVEEFQWLRLMLFVVVQRAMLRKVA